MSETHKHNGKPVQTEPHVDFDYSYFDQHSIAEERDDVRLTRIEFEVAQRMVTAIAEHEKPALAADFCLWYFSFSKQGARQFAKKHGYSDHTGFIYAARKFSKKFTEVSPDVKD